MSRFLFIFIIMISCLSSALGNRLETRIETSQLKSKENLRVRKTFGHNMTPNSYTLNQGDCVVGFYIAGCGVTDNFMIGTSPWLYLNYNSNTIAGRYAFNLNKHHRIGLQSLYIKSHENYTGFSGYIMETVRSNLTLTTYESNLLTTHLALTYEHFFDETRAHSLRRNPLNDQPYQISVTHLTEFSINDRYSIQGEWGMHGVNYHYPQLWTGFSFLFKSKNSVVQLGASMNGTATSYFSSSKQDTQGDFIDNKGTTFYGEDGKFLARRDFAIHPEIQWQYFF